MNIRRRLFRMVAASALVLGLASAVEAQGRRGGNSNGNTDTNRGNNGTNTGNNGTFAAPELSPATATAAIALLSGGLLVLTVRRTRRRSAK